MLLWTKQFETGVEKIDQQHRTLIANINHLEEQLHITNPTKEDCEFIIRLVDFLETYADKHFTQEEECMSRFRCPAHEQNKRGHEYFRSLIREYQKRFAHEGFSVELLQKLHAAARAWIQDHILKIDTQLRAVINS